MPFITSLNFASRQQAKHHPSHSAPSAQHSALVGIEVFTKPPLCLAVGEAPLSAQQSLGSLLGIEASRDFMRNVRKTERSIFATGK